MMNLTGRISRCFSQWVRVSAYEGQFSGVGKLELDNPKKKNALSV